MTRRAAFTPEQEARIAEIVREVLMDLQRQRQARETGQLDHDLAWAIHGIGGRND